MTQHVIDFPNSNAAARETRNQLLAALGTENQPGHWMNFMRIVTERLPDVLSSGRPSKEAIQRSPVGQLGFASWQEMVEAPVEAGGLGWNLHGWKAWRRSWNVVLDNPWLLGQPMTASEINSIALDCKASGIAFPASLDDLKAMRENRADARAQARAESIQGLTERAEAAEKALADAQASTITLSAKIEQLETQLAAAMAQVAEQAEQIGALRAERDQWKKRAQRPAVAPAKLSRWQHLVAALTGGR